MSTYPRDMKTYVHKTLYTIVQSSPIHNSQVLGKTHRSFHRRMVENAWSIHTLEYYSAMERSKLLIHTSWWACWPPG